MSITLEAEKHTEKRSKSLINQIRRSGKVPGVVYGKDVENVNIAVDAIELSKILRDEGQNAVLTLDVQGDEYQVMVSDLQRDPLSDSLLHVDFQAVRMDEPITSEVLVEIVGDKDGMIDNGIVQQQLRMLQVRALPNNIPDAITFSVENLSVGDTVTVAQLDIPEGVEVLSDAEEVVVTIVPQATETADTEPETGEPELVEQMNDDEAEND